MMSVVTLILEIFALIVKVNVTVFEFFYKLFTTEEKNVSGEIVLITGAGKIILFHLRYFLIRIKLKVRVLEKKWQFNIRHLARRSSAGTLMNV
jgi:hypothetical protein